VLRFFNLHRATPSEEQMGLDWSVHKELAFNFNDFDHNCDGEDKHGTLLHSTFKTFFSQPINQLLHIAATARPALAGFRRRQIRPASFINVIPLE